MVLNKIFGVDASFALIVWDEAHGPREVLRIIPLCGARYNKKLGHFLLIHISLDRSVRRRSQRTEDEQDLVAFNELARLLDGPGGAEGVVIADEGDPAAVDA